MTTSSTTALTPTSPSILSFLSMASKDLNTTLPPPADIFSFGDSNARVTDELNTLALAGKKTATTSFPVPRPQHWTVGDLSVGLDGSGEPCFIMRTTELRVLEFQDVDADFARDEGEGDGSLGYYLEAHRGWYKDQKDHDGTVFGDGVGKKVLCERFEIIWPLGVGKKLNDVDWS